MHRTKRVLTLSPCCRQTISLAINRHAWRCKACNLWWNVNIHKRIVWRRGDTIRWGTARSWYGRELLNNDFESRISTIDVFADDPAFQPPFEELDAGQFEDGSCPPRVTHRPVYGEWEPMTMTATSSNVVEELVEEAMQALVDVLEANELGQFDKAHKRARDAARYVRRLSRQFREDADDDD